MTRVVVVDLLCNSPFYCGALAAALADSGAEAELASPSFYLERDVLDRDQRASWVTDLVVHVNRPRFLRLAVRSIELALNGLRLLSRIRSRRYDVVHVQWIPLDSRTSLPMRILRRVCDRSGTLLVVTAHNALPHDRDEADPTTIRENLDLAHLVVAHADHVAKELVDDLGITTSIEVIPHGPLFMDRELPSRAEAAARLGVGAGPTVLFLGLIRPYKGVDILADAWPAVLASFPDATLLIVGKILDARVAPDVERLRHQRGVEVVDRYVSVPRMLDYYAICDVVAFPYHRISQSGGLMTAVGLGRPTVITPIDGLLEQTRTLTSAIVANGIDAPAVADALTSSLDHADEQLAAAGLDRRTIANSPIGWRAVAAATMAAYATRAAARRQDRSS
jgi:glycosyltransferase involved in cell wall biosynthesis